MENILLGAIIAFIITFYSIPVIIQVSRMKKLYDVPNDRKLHLNPVPSLGGLGIFAGFMMGLLLMVNLSEKSAASTFQYYLTALLVIFFFGIKDDILILTPFKKFIGQITVTAILVFKANLLISNMHGFLSIGEIDYTLSCCLSFFTILVIINAFNLIDGVDGLAGSMGVISSAFFAFFSLMVGDIYYALFGFCFAASLAAFLIYNYSPARIFMGDTGAMLVGAVNAILVIHFINTAETSRILPVLASPAMGFGVLLIPLLDTLRVFGIRIIHGRSPFSPDRNHIHHLLLDRGYSHMKVTLLLSLSAILFIVLTFFALPMGTTKVIMAQIGFFFSAVAFLNYTKPRAKEFVVIKGNMEPKNDNIFRKSANGFRTYITGTTVSPESE
jgi:UDP-GlcNAc:undecaprenyl-phosphate/decaprenyl-phosphate GlcNAc-1-phosphate transferase